MATNMDACPRELKIGSWRQPLRISASTHLLVVEFDACPRELKIGGWRRQPVLLLHP
jgi:hypothetical protein